MVLVSTCAVRYKANRTGWIGRPCSPEGRTFTAPLSGRSLWRHILGNSRVRWTRRVGAIMLSLSLLFVGIVAVGLTSAPPASATSSCPYTPNYYAGGTDGAGSRWGVQGLISARSESVPSQNGNFTDEAVHAIGSPNGLEVGWYVGYGNQTGAYVTSPHLYATLNGPSEVDGPSVSTSSDDWYSTWWSGSTDHYRVETGINGSTVWSGTISAGTSGPGTIVALGATNSTSLPMGPSTLSSLQHLYSNGVWYNWSSMTTCADSPYSVSSSGPTSVSNS